MQLLLHMDNDFEYGHILNTKISTGNRKTSVLINTSGTPFYCKSGPQKPPKKMLFFLGGVHIVFYFLIRTVYI